jgi:hypothetical protein
MFLISAEWQWRLVRKRDRGLNIKTSSSHSVNVLNEQLLAECAVMYKEHEWTQMEIENLNKDIDELKSLLALAMRKVVTEVIQDNVNLLIAKTASLMDQTAIMISNESNWKMVYKGKKNESLKVILKEARPIPVMCNRYELLNKLMDKEIKVQDVKSSQRRNEKSKAKGKEEKTRHEVLIIGDSHARGMAEELQHNLDKKFEVQGIVKPVSYCLS